MTDTVTLSKERYEELIIAEKWLRALEEGGVDNWEWYYESLKEAGLLEEKEDLK
jgi:hypothetical protein